MTVILGKPIRKIKMKPYAPPPSSPWEPSWPWYSPSRKFRVIKDGQGEYAIQKKGWFWWNIITVCTGEVWFWPTYGPGVYKDWTRAIEKMEWEELK